MYSLSYLFSSLTDFDIPFFNRGLPPLSTGLRGRDVYPKFDGKILQRMFIRERSVGSEFYVLHEFSFEVGLRPQENTSRASW